MPNLFFTSDTHFGHANVIKYCARPWATVEEMNEGLIERWNSVVKPEDTIWHLGDVAMGLSKKDLPNIIQRLNGQKHLVRGNHDGSSIDFYLGCGFISVGPYAVVDHNNVRLNLAHMPFEDEYGMLSDRGYEGLALCGHVHEKWAAKQLNGMNVLNVGVDQWNWTPISFDEIIHVSRWFGGNA
jgi:calcineurin-like phosphoesterase family protein